MSKGRLEAFSDGVMAIIITIMVLEIKVPHGDTLESLQPLLPVFLSYVLSFIYIGIYWNNHHHLMHIAPHVSGGVLWANTHLLFWLSLVPFVTEWMDENNFTALPVALYGFVLFMAGAAYYMLTQTLIHVHGKDSLIARLGIDKKGIVSIVAYTAGILLSFHFPAISLAIYAAVAATWFIPDRRIEKLLHENKKQEAP